MTLWVVMGVSGCGKSTVARLLAEKAKGDFIDADDFHPPANKQKMAAGIPLTDNDRWGWLDLLNTELKYRRDAGETVFLACSALRQVYRDRLGDDLPGLRFIYLKGSKECIRQRMESRRGHFMPPALLDSQFAALEEPGEAVVVDIGQPADQLAELIWSQIR